MKPDLAPMRHVTKSAHWTKRNKQQWPLHALAVTIVLGLGVVALPSAQAQTFTVLHVFAGYPTDGGAPHGGLVTDAKGNFYGTTYYGGTANLGTVFKLAGKKGTVLHNFGSGTDGASPYDSLVIDDKGILYGTTSQGGTLAFGTVFKMAGKNETVLQNFTGGPDGFAPLAGLVMDAKGIFYGTTSHGGDSGYGTVFKMTKAGKRTVLYSFAGGRDGSYPAVAGVILDAKGNLYGTTSGGGPSNAGTVFRLTKGGQETVLHTFVGKPTDGALPLAGVILGANGVLYGTTSEGGTSNAGTVFKITTKGTETVLYSFKASPDGANPSAGLVTDAKGNFYGTTVAGGTTGRGTVFEVNGKGKETILHSFAGGATDGEAPSGTLILDAKGDLYGTTSSGGTGICADGCGMVFKLTH
jgi:uncharacterized repeat protein (TIGR03803 family)